MTPDMNNDPLVLLALAATAWALLGFQSWRIRRAERARRDEEWRNRWH